MEIFEILTSLRKERGIYQKELASYLNVSIGTISNYEQGIHYPDLPTLCKIADFYGVTTDYLLCRTKSRYAPEDFSKKISADYTVADLVNTTIELPRQDTDRIIDYVKLIKFKHDADRAVSQSLPPYNT